MAYLTDISEVKEREESLSDTILRVNSNLEAQVNNDIMNYFVVSLRDKVKITTNPDVIDNILSRF